MICDYINSFPGRLSALILNENEQMNGYKYTQHTEMVKLGTWATEVEILATAKCLKRDIITYYKGRWVCHSYVNTESEDAIYLDNSGRNHFDAILYP